MNIYVGNLDYRVDEHKLKDIFNDIGKVSSVKIITDQISGRPRGFAFVEMENEAEGQLAIKKLNGLEVNLRSIIVKQAVPKNTF